jgi:hypothetical protein
VRRERELEPRGVGGKIVERQVAGARRLERLDAILDLGVLAVKELERGDVRVCLVGDEALEAMAVDVGEGELRARGADARGGRSGECPQASRAG